MASAGYSISFIMALAVCLKLWLVIKPVQKALPVLGSIILLMAFVVELSPMGIDLSLPIPMFDINTFSCLLEWFGSV